MPSSSIQLLPTAAGFRAFDQIQLFEPPSRDRE